MWKESRPSWKSVHIHPHRLPTFWYKPISCHQHSHQEPTVLRNMKHWPDVKKGLMVFIQTSLCLLCSSSILLRHHQRHPLPGFVRTVLCLRGRIHPVQVALGEEIVFEGERDRGGERKRERSVAPIKDSDWYNWVISALRERHLLALS